MRTRPLGHTGLTVSEIALGAARGAVTDPDRFQASARTAFESGITLVDTAAGYEDGACETELGRVLPDFPDVHVCTKYRPYADWYPDSPYNGSPEALVSSAEASLRRLGRERLDILLAHGMRTLESFRRFMEDGCYEALVRLRDQGKVRAIGISELSEGDGRHAVLQEAVPGGRLDVVMLTLNLLLQTAADSVLPLTAASGTGTLIMMPLDQAGKGRGLVSEAGALNSVRRLIGRGQLPDEAPWNDPELFSFSRQRPMQETALRFILQHAVSSVCVGMSRPERVVENLRASADGPPYLPPEEFARWKSLFGRISAQAL
ncbi:MAG: aldo/keto reductase [Opitutales bacterium]